MLTWLSGDDLGVPRIEEALVVEWQEGARRVVFSYARQGNGITLHLAAGPQSRHAVPRAVQAVCRWLFQTYPWCEMLFAVIGRERRGIIKTARRAGFTHLTTHDPFIIFVRYRT